MPRTKLHCTANLPRESLPRLVEGLFLHMFALFVDISGPSLWRTLRPVAADMVVESYCSDGSPIYPLADFICRQPGSTTKLREQL